MDELYQMRVFCQIVDSGSMVAAARQLGLSPATISTVLARSEAHLGVRLLHRSTRRLTLSEAGQTWYAHARRILEQTHEAEEAVRRSAQAPQGQLRISLTAGVAERFVYPRLAGFASRYPGIGLELRVTEQMLDMVEHQLDLCLRVGRLPSSDLIARPLRRYQRMCCASPAYLKIHGLPATPQALVDHACLCFRRDGHGDRWEFWMNGRTEELPVQGTLSSNDSRALLQWALNGQGIARLPDWYLQPELQAGKLQRVLPDFDDPRPAAWPGIYAMLPAVKQQTAKVEAFLSFMKPAFESNSGN